MKKIFLVLAAALLLPSLISARETKTSFIELQGAYANALNMNINAIAAQTEGFISGMPFNIEEEFVKYNEKSDGRAIATWNVLSNTKFNIYIRAEKMYHVNDTDKTYSLDYILTFSYNLSYPDLDDFNGDGSFYITSGNPDQSLCGKSAETTEITVETPQTLTEDYYKINLFNDPGFVDGFSGFTGSVDGRMYFKFTESSTSDLHGADKDNYEHGNYTAVVKFFVEGV